MSSGQELSTQALQLEEEQVGGVARGSNLGLCLLHAMMVAAVLIKPMLLAVGPVKSCQDKETVNLHLVLRLPKENNCSYSATPGFTFVLV